jgi:bifunctional oligoribonuclease and PAP phosphatase NrnA
MLDRNVLQRFENLLSKSNKVLVLQPDIDQVDPDSIRSALAIGSLLENKGVKVFNFLSGELPKVFQIIPGWKKFSYEFPEEYDIAVLVDCGGPPGQMPDSLAKFDKAFREHPFVIIDHHANRVPAPFTTIDLVEPEAISTSEVLYDICKYFDWPIDSLTAEHMIWSILSDSMMLRLAERPETLAILGELAMVSKISVRDFYNLDQEVRALPFSFFCKKVELMNKVELYLNNRLAMVFISKETDREFKDSGLDSPGHLLRPEIREISGVELYLTITEGEDGSYRCSARSSDESALAARVARHFGGGGHDGAAGFTVMGKNKVELREEIVKLVEEILT